MSQASLILPNTGTLSGLALVNELNAALAAITSQSSGATDPSTLAGGVQPLSFWADQSVTPNILRMRNSANTAWLPIGDVTQVALGLASVASLQQGSYISAVAGGTSNALTITLSTTLTSLTNGQPFVVTAAAANTGTAAMVVTLGSTAMPSAAIVKGANVQIVAGDIPAAGYPCLFNWSQGFGAYVLQNPATGIGTPTITSKVQPISASVASNALTLTLNPTILDFRSATLGSGAVNTRSISAALSLIVPSGATLGTVSATKSRLALIAIDNAGTVELAVVNIIGGNNLDETTLISTTAISAGAIAANVIYSTTARTNVPFRVVGYIESTQATAGIWGAAPSTVQGSGGGAIIAPLRSLTTAKAWVLFDGSLTGTNAPISGFNVASVTKNSTGDYTVNFSSPFADINYLMLGNIAGNSTFSSVVPIIKSATQFGSPSNKTTSFCEIITPNYSGLSDNVTQIMLVFFGN